MLITSKVLVLTTARLIRRCYVVSIMEAYRCANSDDCMISAVDWPIEYGWISMVRSFCRRCCCCDEFLRRDEWRFVVGALLSCKWVWFVTIFEGLGCLVAVMCPYLHHDSESDFDAESFCVMVRYVPCSSYFVHLTYVASNSDKSAISYRPWFRMTMLLLYR